MINDRVAADGISFSKPAPELLADTVDEQPADSKASIIAVHRQDMHDRLFLMLINKAHHSFRDISGQKFGKLTAVQIVGKNRGYLVWECVCDCGRRTTATRTKLESAHTRSCGCLIDEGRRSRAKHRMIKTPEYRAWCGMKGRCLTETNQRYAYYGGRGILVHPAWIDSFEEFFSHVGVRPSHEHSLDRIDVNGNYEPGNVRWATDLVQKRNKRSVKLYEFRGETRPAIEWAEILEVPYERVRDRLYRGWPIAEALLQPKVKPTGIRRL